MRGDGGGRTGNASNCPVPDLTYLDEYYSLDTDCSDGLSMAEFQRTTTLFDGPSYLALVPYPLPRAVSSFAKTMIESKWAKAFAAAAWSAALANGYTNAQLIKLLSVSGFLYCASRAPIPSMVVATAAALSHDPLPRSTARVRSTWQTSTTRSHSSHSRRWRR